jgi:hypothetical protein
MFDDNINKTLEAILNCSLSAPERNELSLPSALGGLYLSTATNTALPAYLGSLISTVQICNKLLKKPPESVPNSIIQALEVFNREQSTDISMQALLAFPKAQKYLSNIVNSNIRKSLFDNADFTEKSGLTQQLISTHLVGLQP